MRLTLIICNTHLTINYIYIIIRYIIVFMWNCCSPITKLSLLKRPLLSFTDLLTHEADSSALGQMHPAAEQGIEAGGFFPALRPLEAAKGATWIRQPSWRQLMRCGGSQKHLLPPPPALPHPASIIQRQPLGSMSGEEHVKQSRQSECGMAFGMAVSTGREDAVTAVFQQRL